MAAVASMKERDQRFLLIGINPSFKENPQRPPAASPRMQAQTVHLRFSFHQLHQYSSTASVFHDIVDLIALAFQSWCIMSIRPAAVPSQTNAILDKYQNDKIAFFFREACSL